MGIEIIPNHADYRLMSSRVLDALAGYSEVNLFLRGIIPHMGFKSSIVYYARAERIAGSTHYPLGKMISFDLVFGFEETEAAAKMEEIREKVAEKYEGYKVSIILVI